MPLVAERMLFSREGETLGGVLFFAIPPYIVNLTSFPAGFIKLGVACG